MKKSCLVVDSREYMRVVEGSYVTRKLVWAFLWHKMEAQLLLSKWTERRITNTNNLIEWNSDQKAKNCYYSIHAAPVVQGYWTPFTIPAYSAIDLGADQSRKFPMVWELQRYHYLKIKLNLLNNYQENQVMDILQPKKKMKEKIQSTISHRRTTKQP